MKVAEVVLAELEPAHLMVAPLGLGTAIGQTLAAIPLVIATRWFRGEVAVQEVRHATLAGLAAAVDSAVGVAVSNAVPMSQTLLAVGVAVLTAACAVIAFGVIAHLLTTAICEQPWRGCARSAGYAVPAW